MATSGKAHPVDGMVVVMAAGELPDMAQVEEVAPLMCASEAWLMNTLLRWPVAAAVGRDARMEAVVAA